MKQTNPTQTAKELSQAAGSSKLLSAYRDAYVEMRLAHLRGLVTGSLGDFRAYGALCVRADELARQLPAWLREQVETSIDAAFPKAA